MARMGYQAQSKSTREKTQNHLDSIEASIILQKLIDHVVDGAEMSQTQIRAAEILLRKKLPDLKATELTGADGKALAVNIVRYSDDPQ